MICGNFVDKFKYANICVMTGVYAGDSEDFEIVSVNDKEIILEGGITKEIHHNKNGSEYIIMDSVGVYEQMFMKGKPSKVKCEPFLDKHREHNFKPEIAPLKVFEEKKLTQKEIEDMHDTSKWHATCSECGYEKMEYVASTYRYHCPKCGNILEV